MSDKKPKTVRGLPSDWEMLAEAMSGRKLGPIEARAYLAGFQSGWVQGSFAQYLSFDGDQKKKTLERAFESFRKAHPDVP